MSPAAPSQRIRRRGADDEEQSEETSQLQAAGANQTTGTARGSVGVSHPSSATEPFAAQSQPQPADVQPLPEQFSQRKRPRRSARLACHLDKLAVVEMQSVLQFLDTKSKLMAAPCSRRLLQAADHPFAWQGSTVAVSSRCQPQLGSLIRQSLLRHAPIALTFAEFVDLSVAEVAAIPHLRELDVRLYDPAVLIQQLLALPSLQGLRTLRAYCSLPLSTLQLLPTLPALHTLERWVWDDSADWSWLPTMPALTDLHLAFCSESLPRPAIGAIGQCARLQSLRLDFKVFGQEGDLARLCSTPALRRLRHLTLDNFQADNSALPLLELRLEVAAGIDAWRSSWLYQMAFISASERDQMDEQWRGLQRMAAEMERVTIVKK